MGFNSAFKGLNCYGVCTQIILCALYEVTLRLVTLINFMYMSTQVSNNLFSQVCYKLIYFLFQ